MGKTFRRDSNWNKEKEQRFKKQRDREAEIRRALRKAAEEADAEPNSDFGGTKNENWKNQRGEERK
jgi:hypothetical protein